MRAHLLIPILLLLAACSSSSATDSAHGSDATASQRELIPVKKVPSSQPSPVPSTVPSSSPSSASVAVTTAAPVAPTIAPKVLADTSLVYVGLGFAVSDSEARCLADAAGPDLMSSALAAGELDAKTAGALYRALAHCEPASYVAQTTANYIAATGIDDGAARCALKALDAVVVSDPSITDNGPDSSAWPAAQQDMVVAALSSCVSPDAAATIVRN
jgi:hypothetical protein